MKVKLCLDQRAHVPTYEVNRGRYIVGDWEPGEPAIRVPFGPEEIPSYAADITEPINVPLHMCSWWAPVRVAEKKGKR